MVYGDPDGLTHPASFLALSSRASRPCAAQEVRLCAERLLAAILHHSASELLFCSILSKIREVTGHRNTFAPHMPSHRSTCEQQTKRERP